MAKSTLNEGEKSFRGLAENLPGIVYRVLIEDDNRVIFFNNMVQTMTGYSPEDLKKGKVCSIDPLILPEDKLKVINIVKDAIENNVPFEAEYRINNKSGELKWFFERGRPIRGDNGNPSYIDGVIFDITNRKKAEQRLRESEEKFRLLFDSIADPIHVIDADLKIIYMNPAFERWLKSFNLDLNIVGKTSVEAWPFIGEKVYDEYQKVFKTKKKHIKEGWAHFNDTDTFTETRKIPILKSGNVVQVITIIRDFSDRKKAEQKLEESENKFKLYYENAPMGYQSLDSNGNILDVNKAWINFFGYSKEEVIGKSFGDFIDSEYLEAYNTRFLKFKETGELAKADFEIIKKDGSHAIVLFNGNINFDENGNFKQTHCIFQDITEQQQIQIELRESENLLKNAQELAHIGHWKLDPSTMGLSGSDELFKIFGLTRDEATLEKFTEVVHPEDREMDLFHIRRGMEKGESWDIEHRVISKDGTEKWVHALGEAVKDDNGRIIMLMGTVQDITERRKIMEELRIKDLVFNASLSAQSTADINGIIDHVNPAFLELWGYKSKEEAIGASIGSFFANPDDAVPILETITEAGKWEGEFLAKRCDGSTFISQGFASAIYNENGDQIGFQSANLNITKRKKADKIISDLSKFPSENPNPVLRVTKEKILYANSKAVDLLNITENKDLPVILKGQIHETFSKKSQVMMDIKLNNCTYSFVITPIVNEEYANLYGRNITKRKEIEEKLKESEERFKYLISSNPAVIYTSKVSGDYGATFISDNSVSLWGFEPKNFVENSEFWLDHIHPDDREPVLSILSELSDKDHIIHDYRFKVRNDTYRWMLDEVFLIRDDSGNPKEIIGSVIDITDRKISELKLKESEEKYRKQNVFLNNILESLTHPFYVINVKDYKVALTNSTASSEGLEKGQYCYSLTHHNNKPCEAPCVCPLNEVKNTKKACVVEHTHYDKEGNEKIYEIYGYPILDESGNVVQMIEYALNITPRKIVQHKLKESEEKYRTIAEQSLMGIIIIQNGRVIYANEAESSIMEYSIPEIMEWGQEDLLKHIHPDDIAKAINRSRKKQQGQEVPPSFSYRIVTKSGIPKDVEVNTQDIEFNEKPAILTYVLDVTEKKVAEQKYESLINNLTDIILELDIKGIASYVSPQCYDILGYQPSEIIGKSALLFVHPEDTSVIAESMKKAFGTEETISILPYRLLHKDGYVINASARGKYVNVGGNGKFIVAIRDITFQKRIEQELKLSEEKYRHIVESIPIGMHMYQLDANNNLVFTGANPSADKLLGVDNNQFIGKTIEEAFPQLTNTEIPEKYRQAAKEGKTWSTLSLTYEDELIQGAYEVTAFQISPKKMVASFINITDRKKTEQRLKKSEEKYRQLFENSPISLWEEDFSEVKNYIEILKNSGIKDFRAYFDKNPEEVKKCVSMIKLVDINKKTLELYKANKKEDFLAGLEKIFTEVSLDAFKEQIITFVRGKTWFESEAINWTLNGEKIHIFIVSEIVTGFKEDWSKILVSITDISDRKKAEQELKDSEERYRTQNVFLNNILESLTHPFYVINAKDYKVVLANSTASSEGLEKGQYCYSLTHHNNKPCEAPCVCPVNIVKKTKKSCVVEHIHYDKEGSEKIYEIYGYPILDENGNVVQMIEYALNITDRKIAQQELKKSEEKYRHLFENSPYYIILLDKDGNFIDCNNSAVDIFGYYKEDLLSNNFREMSIIPPELLPLLENNIELLIKGERVSPLEFIPIRKDGKKIWINAQASLIKLDSEFFIYVIGQDITERKKAERKLKESEENSRDLAHQWRTTFDAMSEPVFLLDLERNILQCNKITLDFLGKKDYDEIIGHSCCEIVHGTKEPAEWCPMVHMIESSYKESSIVQIGDRWCELSVDPVINDEGTLVGAVHIITDITEKKEAEQELIKLSNLKSELLSRTSHELKTPLVSIKGFTDILLELHSEKLDDYVLKTLKQIKIGCNRLESLVHDILKTAELKSGALELKKSKDDLSILIKMCVSELEGMIELRNHTINLEISDNLICSFEREQIYNVITNILSNAIKYTPYNGKIEVKSEIKDDFVIVSVKDNGIGFSKEERSLIFKQFGKIERYGQGYDVISEGSGLGLYISKKIIEMHGGEIWVESEGKDKGSTVYFTLPIV